VRIRYRYRGNEKTFDQPSEVVVLGRPRPGVHVDIDLSPDLRVSRPHARISAEGGNCWIEDLGSANGTEVDGQPIKGKGKLRLEPGQIIRISDTRSNWSFRSRPRIVLPVGRRTTARSLTLTTVASTSRK